MTAPFFKYGAFGDEFSLIVAVVIGFGFGFFLERGGFGHAPKLAAQFYLRDMTVFKVMFSAIVTAMLGTFYLSWIGILDLELVYLSPTYIWPQLVGGAFLGVGFVVGGYCPGTAVVGVSTGHLDAILFLLGIGFGILVFGEAYPFMESFVNSGNLGELTIAEAFHLRYGLVVLLVVLIAVGGFRGAEAVERFMADKSQEVTT